MIKTDVSKENSCGESILAHGGGANSSHSCHSDIKKCTYSLFPNFLRAPTETLIRQFLNIDLHTVINWSKKQLFDSFTKFGMTTLRIVLVENSCEHKMESSNRSGPGMKLIFEKLPSKISLLEIVNHFRNT